MISQQHYEQGYNRKEHPLFQHARKSIARWYVTRVRVTFCATVVLFGRLSESGQIEVLLKACFSTEVFQGQLLLNSKRKIVD